MGEEELGAVNGQSSNGVIQVPEERRAECGLVERDRSVSRRSRPTWERSESSLRGPRA